MLNNMLFTFHLIFFKMCPHLKFLPHRHFTRMAAVETELDGRSYPRDAPLTQRHALVSRLIVPCLSSLAGVSPVLSVPSHQPLDALASVSWQAVSPSPAFHIKLPLFGHTFVETLCRSARQLLPVAEMPGSAAAAADEGRRGGRCSRVGGGRG